MSERPNQPCSSTNSTRVGAKLGSLVLVMVTQFAISAGFVACTVDDRVLLETDEESGGAGGRTGTAGRSGGAGRAGSIGEAGAGSPVCADLDGNTVPDCAETLAENSTFDDDSDLWSAEEGIELDWSSTDAQTLQSSGSLVVHNTFTADQDNYVTRAATQCVSVKGARVYHIYAENLIQGESVVGFAMLGVRFYDGEDCTGSASVGVTNQTGTLQRWVKLRGQFNSPATARSLLVQLGVVKLFRQQEPFTAHFDNILVRSD